MSTVRPIFILASQRSFTSIICAMLGQHPEAYGVPEVNLFVRDTMEELISATKGQNQFIIHGLWRTVAQLYAGEQTIESVEMARRWVHQRRNLSTGEVYRELCAQVAPLRIVDKSPAYAENPQALARIAQTFPTAQYIYIVRHPLEQGQSVLKSPQGIMSLLGADSLDYDTDLPTIDPQYLWYRTQKQILDFLATIPTQRQYRMRGEDFLSAPRHYLEQICRWLNFSWDESIYAAMLCTEESPFASMGPFGAQWGNNPGFQNSPAFRQRALAPIEYTGNLPWRDDNRGFTSEVVALLRELGYES